MEPATLAGVVAGLLPDEHAALSAIIVDFLPDTRVVASFEIALWLTARSVSPADRLIREVERFLAGDDPADDADAVAHDDLPTGVGLSAWSKVPAIRAEIAIDVPIQDQIDALASCGLGQLNSARFAHHAGRPLTAHAAAAEHPDGPVLYRWIIKTHAGSDLERIVWALQKPETLGGPRRVLTPDEIAGIAERLEQRRHTRRRWRRPMRRGIPARYPGVCARSGQRFQPGTLIVRHGARWAIADTEGA